MLKRVYVWEFPVRLTHWINVLSIVSLSITGYYIGNPFIHAISTDQYIMGWMRFIHFVAAYLITVSFLIRIYWLLAGNKYASWRAFNPFSAGKFKELIEETKFYLFLKKEPPKPVGHSVLAIYVYLGLFMLFIVQILTGFALYSQSHVGFFWKLMGGWMLSLFDAQTLRLYHHLIMWLIITYFIAHVYMAWMHDRAERGGMMSSIFSGYKPVEEDN
jgi:Ni/Fe-hydrogenase 1 B-type cytochrome subunit